MSLEGLDPYPLLDREAIRLGAFFSAMHGDDWDRPSRCPGWRVRDVLAHLAGTERYHHACLDDTLDVLLAEAAAAGASDLDSFNAWGVAAYAGAPPEKVFGEWWAATRETLHRLRSRDGGTMTTMWPAYPVRLQAFHVAAELATHADDVGVPETTWEHAGRAAWRARVAYFALAEAHRPVALRPAGDSWLAEAEGVEAVLSAADLVDAADGRLPAGLLPDPVEHALHAGQAG